MPQVKAKDLRSLSIDELNDKAEALRKDIFHLRVDAKLSKLENLMKIKQTRRELAKVLTVKHELAAEEPVKPAEKRTEKPAEKVVTKAQAAKALKELKKHG